MIIDTHKAIFIHIPKNAGTSIETYFANESFRIQPSKHADIYEIKRKFKNSYNSYRKFTIVRNPYDKMVSWYFYLKRNLDSKAEVVDFNDWKTAMKYLNENKQFVLNILKQDEK